jgi:hypothetical protein
VPAGRGFVGGTRRRSSAPSRRVRERERIADAEARWLRGNCARIGLLKWVSMVLGGGVGRWLLPAGHAAPSFLALQARTSAPCCSRYICCPLCSPLT